MAVPYIYQGDNKATSDAQKGVEFQKATEVAVARARGEVDHELEKADIC